jgi:hypothetical protein
MGGSPLWWILGFVVVLGLLWFLFSRLATSDTGGGKEPKDLRGPSGGAWTPKHPDAGDTGEGNPPSTPPGTHPDPDER